MLVSNGGRVFKALLLTHTNTSPVPDEVMRLIHCKWIGFEEAGLALRCLSTLDLELLVGVTQTATSAQAHTRTDVDRADCALCLSLCIMFCKHGFESLQESCTIQQRLILQSSWADSETDVFLKRLTPQFPTFLTP